MIDNTHTSEHDKLPYKKLYLKSILQADVRDNRISEILHEEIGSELMAIKLKLSESTIVHDDRIEMENLLNKLLSKIKVLSDSICPSALIELGVGKALQQKCRKLNELGPINVAFYGFGTDRDNLDLEKQTGLYHASNEIIDNCIKHANCSELRISAIGSKDQYCVKIEDNGEGFEPNEDTIFQDTYKGLQKVYGRVIQIGGSISFQKNDRGTVVTITVKR